MSSRLTDLVIDAKDSWSLAEWWSKVLEVPVGEKKDEDGERYAELRPIDSVRTLLFADVPEGKVAKNRVHIDLRPHGVDQATELERLKSLGAVEIDVGQRDPTWHVLADPEGNEFCLLRGRADEPSD